MITKEEFIELINNHKEWCESVDKVEEVLNNTFPGINCNIHELDWIDYGGILFDNTLKLLFTDEGVDDIIWWLFERPMFPPGPRMWDENGEEIPTETIEDLWNIVKDNRK